MMLCVILLVPIQSNYTKETTIGSLKNNEAVF